jgi:GT2 family glycosyltransferase/2-polyprenyl-3-methyl-5-hydroxy-6-metoxy-1,4-benzoquinol methylase/tetratricopeptide (TPR) repeat protein
LGHLVEVEHFLPAELESLRPGEFDLYLRIDDGLSYPLPDRLRPAAWWVIDTHLDLAGALEKAPRFDFVFAAQRDGATALREVGIETAVWLPLACDPEIHGRKPVEPTFDLAFVGNLFPGPRTDLVALLQAKFKNVFVGNRYLEQMAATYSASKIVFNRSLKNDVNMRVFEALAGGSLLVTNELADNGQPELFRDGEHLVTYTDAEELLDKVAYYLEHDEERERIAAAGRRAVLEGHTYLHRMRTILRTVERSLSLIHEQTAVAAEHQPAESAHQPPPSAANKPPLAAADYYSFARPELLEMIPTAAMRVLDVGCGAGALGASLKARQAAEVWGLEREPAVAEAARRRLDRVLTGDAEQVEQELADTEFDCIVCGDVLEHLRAPEQFLRRARTWLRPGGRLIASIPNVRHHSVVGSLLAGNFTYESAGLLDQDHVRFFTRREIEKLLFRSGFELQSLKIVPGPGYAAWAKVGHPGSVRVGRLQIQGMSPAEAAEFYAYQYLIEATVAPLRDDGLTSIVLVTHNQLAYTRGCLDSIRQFTDEPYELICVDNGSTDGTPRYLQSIDGARVILNSDNRGFPAAVNQGLEIAVGRQVLLLNNDTLVTTGWLRRMLDALHADPAVGLVGPTTNNISGEQQIPVGYDDLAQLDGFAWDCGRRFAGQYQQTDRLVGFCLLISREVIQRIGVFDERFGIGNFEDDDFCRRALQAGFLAVIARNTFIHHFGSRTFAASGIDFRQLLTDNQRLYQDKWNDAGPTTHNPESITLKDTDPATPTSVSLCMIVRDNADTLEAALIGIRPWVDEMIVVDTGSNDETPKIAERLGATVYHFPWCDDFSAARNESLKYASGEWLFWMDSDDTIDEANGRTLRALVDGPHADTTLGYVMQVHCPGRDDGGVGDVTAVDHVKLFRNRPDLRFEGRIHEQILPAIRRAGGEVEFTDIFVLHSGADNSANGRAGKYARDFRLLELELADHPDHPFALFNLGMTHADAGNHDEAAEYLERCLEVSEPGGSHLRKAHALLVSTHAQAARHDAAWDACVAGLREFPDDPELLFRSGMLHHHFGRHDAAIAAYHAVINDRSTRHFSSVDTAITGYKARHNLALVHEDLQQWTDAEIQWRGVTAEAPHYRLGWRGLGHVLLRQNNLTAAAELASQLSGDANSLKNLRCEGLLLAARIAQIEHDGERANRILTAARQEFPEDLEPLREHCQWLFEQGDFSAAEAALRELWSRDPADGSAPHNLGTIYLAAGETEKAVAAFTASLRIRPSSAATHQLLGQAMSVTGNLEEARVCWQAALQLDPTNQAARAALATVDAG